VELIAGDRVPADMRLVKVHKLQIDESAVTGNSHVVSKSTLAIDDKSPIIAQKNMVFLGSTVSSGSGLGVVVARGGATEASTYNKPRVSLIQKRRINILAKNGIYTQNSRVLGKSSKKKTVVVVDAPIAASDARHFMHKNPKRVGGYVFIQQKDYAGVFAGTLGTEVYHSGNNSSYNHQIVVAASSSADTLKLISTLQAQKENVLFVTNNVAKTPAMHAADYVFLIGKNHTDTVKLCADFIAQNADINTIEKLVLILDK
jgi:hypothetical protein